MFIVLKEYFVTVKDEMEFIGEMGINIYDIYKIDSIKGHPNFSTIILYDRFSKERNDFIVRSGIHKLVEYLNEQK